MFEPSNCIVPYPIAYPQSMLKPREKDLSINNSSIANTLVSYTFLLNCVFGFTKNAMALPEYKIGSNLYLST